MVTPRGPSPLGKGRCGYATGAEEDLKRRAIDFCRGKTDQTCTLYVVDDEVVTDANLVTVPRRIQIEGTPCTRR